MGEKGKNRKGESGGKKGQNSRKQKKRGQLHLFAWQKSPINADGSLEGHEDSETAEDCWEKKKKRKKKVETRGGKKTPPAP